MKTKRNFISLISVVFILLTGMALTGCVQTADSIAFNARFYTEEKGQHDEAIKHAKQGIAIDPKYAPNWYWMGLAYYRKGNYDEAIAALNKVVELRPVGEQIQSAYNFLGWAYYYKGNFSETIRNLNKAIELKPLDSPSISLRGSAYYMVGNYNDAVKDFSKAIELKPLDGASFLNRGWAYYMKGEYSEAKKDFNKAIENIEPKNKDKEMMAALRGKAFTYLGIGDAETAVNLIKQAKTASDYDNNRDLSLIYYVAGDKEKAWEHRGGKGAVGMQIKDYKKESIIGAEVFKTIAGSPAEKAGVLTGDVVIKVDDKDVAGLTDFLSKVSKLVPGTTVKIRVLREGAEKEISIKVAFADFIMETDPLIAHVMAKKKSETAKAAQSELAVSAPLAQFGSDVDDLPAIKAKPNKNAYAIVIGIENYRQKLPKADYAVSDAKIMTEYLIKVMGYPAENVVTLINEYAAKSDFEKYFEKWLWNNAEKESTVFVYYSGHGAPDVKSGNAFLVPYDGDPAFIDQTGYSLKRLYEALGKLQVKEIIVALDSCFSGAGGKSVIAKGARPLVMNLERDIMPVKNMIVLSAASGDQISSTYEEKGHGLFTYFMLKGIKDGITEVGELFDYMHPQVSRVARKAYNNDQSPQLIAPKENRKVFLLERIK